MGSMKPTVLRAQTEEKFIKKGTCLQILYKHPDFVIVQRDIRGEGTIRAVDPNS